MNMKELTEKLSKATGETKKRSEEIIKKFLDIVEDELAAGGSVKLVGHFSLEVKERKARKGRNPQTGKEIHIPEKKAVKFSVGKALAEKVNPDMVLQKAIDKYSDGKKKNKKK